MSVLTTSPETQGHISDLLRFEKIEAQFKGDLAAAQKALIELNKQEILAASGSIMEESTAEITETRAKVVDLQSKLDACQALISETRNAILAAMNLDRTAFSNQLKAELETLNDEEKAAAEEFISALAMATVAQMKYRGFHERAKELGPSLGTVTPELLNLFRSEVEMLSDKRGIDNSWHSPAERITEKRKVMASFRRSATMEDVESAIRAARN